MIIVMTVFFILITIVIQVYIKMIHIKHNVEAKQTLIENSYFMLEKINIELKNYTIDYEEYYNRKLVGCDTITEYNDNFVRNINSWNLNGHCDRFTHYGNANHINGYTSSKHQRYYCSSLVSETNPLRVLQEADVTLWLWCFQETAFTTQPYYQSYWQYAQHFRDRLADVDYDLWAVNDNDDEDIWAGPIAIMDADNVQEFYFIAQDESKRILLRRSLIASGDRNYDGIVSGDVEHRYNLQILKLRWFDAGTNHDFITNEEGVYDGQIDTRACDYAEWFICHGAEIDNILYSWYRLPQDSDDGRVNMFGKNMTIADRNIQIYPTKKPEYSRYENTIQINPYFTISFTNKLYAEIRKKKIGNLSMDDFELTLQTTFNTRNFY